METGIHDDICESAKQKLTEQRRLHGEGLRREDHQHHQRNARNNTYTTVLICCDRLSLIKQEGEKDDEIQILIQYIRSGWPE